MRNEVVLEKVKETREVLRTIKSRKADWIGHILHRNCLLRKRYSKRGRRDGKTRNKT